MDTINEDSGRSSLRRPTTLSSIGNNSSERRRKRAPKDYATAVATHSTRSAHESLYPGIHYRSLARFLQPETHQTSSVPPHRRYPFVTRAHDFAVLHDLAYPRQDPCYATAFDSLDGPLLFATHPPPRDNSGQLLFLRGFPSPGWINSIGARYRIDPEIFRRHLEHGPTYEALDLPGLPSSSLNIIRLTTSTLGSRQVLAIDRQDEGTALQRHFNDLGLNPAVVGESIVRQLWTHDEKHFSIEQQVLICVMRRGDGWLALILLDHGRDLDEGPLGPWLNSSYKQSKFDSLFLPIIQFEPRNWSLDKEVENSDAPSDNGPAAAQRPYAQSASLLSGKQYGQFLVPELMKIDPFYALHGVFAFCASSESQFLNALKIKAEVGANRGNDEVTLQRSLEDFRYHKAIVRRKIDHLLDIVECIRSRGNPKWPSIKLPLDPTQLSASPTSETGPPQNRAAKLVTPQKDVSVLLSFHAEANASAALLLRDYEELVHRAKALFQFYSEEIDDIRTSTALLEARRSTAQAQDMARLSLLAFFFIPLSFTTGIFGMNLRELGDNLSIWVWVITSVPLFGSALVLYFWNPVSRFGQGVFDRCFAASRRSWRKRRSSRPALT